MTAIPDVSTMRHPESIRRGLDLVDDALALIEGGGRIVFPKKRIGETPSAMARLGDDQVEVRITDDGFDRRMICVRTASGMAAVGPVEVPPSDGTERSAWIARSLRDLTATMRTAVGREPSPTPIDASGVVRIAQLIHAAALREGMTGSLAVTVTCASLAGPASASLVNLALGDRWAPSTELDGMLAGLARSSMELDGWAFAHPDRPHVKEPFDAAHGTALKLNPPESLFIDLEEQDACETLRILAGMRSDGPLLVRILEDGNWPF